VIWGPAVCGLLLVVTAGLDGVLFDRGVITGRQAVGHEMVFLLSGFLGLFAQLYFAVKWLLAKRWRPILLSLASGMAFLACLGVISALGAATFYAT